ncbi:hypothetical protein DPMN_075858 [Dreissena polymorpha]|uniref:Uncharacterized protein n=1 Tax=Dreissena polymorpha TaxID=45954 RepID=A0A9D4BPV7_DREPO|nr:hypothetical protein DPMN_075858 [Dreissena polymorpha]
MFFSAQDINRTLIPHRGHVFQQTGTIFELVQDIIGTNYCVIADIMGTNLLTEDRKINVASRVFTRKNAPPPGSHVFQPTGIIYQLFQDIIGMNLLTKFHEDRTVNVASRVLTRFYYSHIRKNAPPLGRHFFQANIIIFKLIQDIIETNLLTKFHEDWTINVASREKCPAPGGHVFKATKTIFELIQDIIGTNLLTKFHKDQKINVTSKVLTRKNSPAPVFHEDRTINVASSVKNAPPPLLTRKNAPPPGGHVFQPTGIIFELVRDIIGINLLTKFHEDWTINLASRLKNAPPLGSHVFQAKVTIFDLIQDISGKNLLSKFHEDRKINVASREKCQAPWRHVFQPTGVIFELVQDIIGMNLMTKFYEDQTITVASRVKNAPPLGSHVFQANITIFELIQDIIETNLLTKFHEDWTINLASRELTRQMLTPHNAQRTTDKKRSQKLTMSTLCSGELKMVIFLKHNYPNKSSTVF